MGIVNQAILRTAFTGFKACYRVGFDKAPSYWAKIAMEVSSDTAEEDYGWIENIPSVREWVGDRVIHQLVAAGYTIKNRIFESTVTVPRTSIEDDKIGLFRPMFEELGLGAKINPDKLLFKLMNDGFTTNCYDGQFFFDTDHPVVNSSNQTTSVSNFGGGSGTPWFLLDTSRAMRPFIFQKRLAPEFQAMDDLSHPEVFNKDRFTYGTRSRCNVGFGLWQFAYGSKQTLDPTNFKAARAAMRSLKLPNGEPMGVKPNLLVVSASQEDAAVDLVEVPTLAGGASNPLYKRVELLVSEWL